MNYFDPDGRSPHGIAIAAFVRKAWGFLKSYGSVDMSFAGGTWLGVNASAQLLPDFGEFQIYPAFPAGGSGVSLSGNLSQDAPADPVLDVSVTGGKGWGGYIGNVQGSDGSVAWKGGGGFGYGLGAAVGFPRWGITGDLFGDRYLSLDPSLQSFLTKVVITIGAVHTDTKVVSYEHGGGTNYSISQSQDIGITNVTYVFETRNGYQTIITSDQLAAEARMNSWLNDIVGFYNSIGSSLYAGGGGGGGGCHAVTCETPYY